MQKKSERILAADYDCIALLLQGGGALGSYHHGVYQALSEGGCEPDWFAGTSIGAIQAAILVGNPPESRLDRLAEFWRRITWPQWWPAPSPTHPLRKPMNIAAALGSAVLGQPGFFQPRSWSPEVWTLENGPLLSFYDTTPLERTLLELIDFGRINNGDLRLSLGCVEVQTGRQVYFDNHRHTLDVRHVMASGALPPAFAPVKIDGCHYWDGGLLSNTPLDVVLNDTPAGNVLCFMIDLFDPHGPVPRDLDEQEDRHKDIRYASRSNTQIQVQRELQNLRQTINDLYERLPETEREDPEIQALATLGKNCNLTNIVHLIYRGQAYRSWAKDFNFLAQTLEDHRRTGYEDGCQAVRESPWEDPVPLHTGVMVHEVNNRR